jgi:hypothetical protein
MAADSNMTRHTRITCWITKAADTRNMYKLLLSYCDNGYANAPKATTIPTLPVLFKFYLHGQTSFPDFCIRPYLKFYSIYRHAGKEETHISEGKHFVIPCATF